MECTNPILIITLFHYENDWIGWIIFIPFEHIGLKTKTFKVTRSLFGQKLKYPGI